VDREKKMVQELVVFILKRVGSFEFEFQVLNAAGFTILKKELTPSLIYEINTDLGYMKWLNLQEGYKVIEINFQGRRDIAMSLKFAIVECLYEHKNKKSLKDEISQD
jgi:hypothetical protein